MMKQNREFELEKYGIFDIMKYQVSRMPIRRGDDFSKLQKSPEMYIKKERTKI